MRVFKLDICTFDYQDRFNNETLINQFEVCIYNLLLKLILYDCVAEGTDMMANVIPSDYRCRGLRGGGGRGTARYRHTE